jgi:hypothetical protein
MKEIWHKYLSRDIERDSIGKGMILSGNCVSKPPETQTPERGQAHLPDLELMRVIADIQK